MPYLVAAAALATLLLFVPVDFLFRAERRGSTTSDISVSWLFGLVRKRFAGGKGGREKEREQEPAPAKRSRPKKRSPRRAFAALMKTPGFARRLLRLPGDILRTFTIRSLEIQALLGFDDPAATGMACGALSAIAPALQGIGPLRWRWEPDFTREVFEGRAAGELRIVPARTLWALGRFALHPTSLRAFRKALREGRG